MDQDTLKTLLKKYGISSTQKYQIRTKNQTLSGPLTIEEIAKAIMEQKYSAQDDISEYPKEQFKPLAQEPIFYDLLFSILQKTDLTEIQKEEITRVLEDPMTVQKLKKRGATPSLFVPKKKKSRRKEDTGALTILPPPPKKIPIRRMVLLFLFIVFIFSVLLLLQNTQQKPHPEQIEPAQKTYLEIWIPPQTVASPSVLKAKQNFEEAQNLYPKDTVRSYEESIQYLKEALKAYPKDVSSLSLLAKCYLQLWDLSKKDVEYFEKVDQIIQRALEIDPSHLQAKQALVFLYFRKKNTQKATEILSQLKTQNNLDGETFLLEGLLFFEQNELNQSIVAFEKALERSPALAQCHYALGKTYEKLNQPEKAYEIYWIGLNLHPEHALSRLQASLIDIQTFNHLKKAEGNLKIVTQFPSLLTDENLATAHYHLGWIYEEEKQFDYAIQHYQKAHDLMPGNTIYTQAYERLGGAQAVKSLPKDIQIHEESLYFLNIGRRYLKDNRLIDAKAQFKAALEIDVKNHLAHYELGQISEKENLLKKAMEHYQRALSIKASHIDSYVALAKIYIHYYDFDAALQYISKVKSIEPRSSEIYALSGFYHKQKGDFPKAILEYQKAVQLNPEHYEALFELAKLYRHTKQYAYAEKYFFRALTLQPNADTIQTQVALLYYERGLKSQAVDHLKKLVSAYPLNTVYLNGLSKLYHLNENFQFSKETYLKSFELDSKNIETLEGLAELYQDTDELEKALKMYKETLKLDPTNAKWYFKRAALHTKSGDLHQALDEYKLASQINTKYPLVHFYAGRTALILKNYRLAEQEFKKEIEINPHLKEPYFLLAELYTQARQFENAQKNYKMYIRLDPNNAQAYFNLAQIHQAQERFETAIEFYKTALDKNSDMADVYLQLGIVYRHLDRKSDAIWAFQNYLRVNPDADNIEQIKKLIQQLRGY